MEMLGPEGGAPLRSTCPRLAILHRIWVVVEEADKFVTKHRAALEDYCHKPRPSSVLAIEVESWPANTRLYKKLAESDPFAYLNFLLQFCPAVGPADVEKPLRAKFAKIGIEAGKQFRLDKLTAAQRALSELLGLDDALVSAAARISPKLPKKGSRGDEYTPWLQSLPEATRTAWLAELMDVRKEQNFFEGRVTEYQKTAALAMASDDEL